MGIELKELLAKPRQEAREDLANLSDVDLLKVVTDLVAQAKGKKVNVGPLGNKNFLKVQSSENDDEETNQRRNDKRNQIINQALGVLEKLGQKLKQEEVGGLAIDRDYDDVKDKMNAIIADINSGRMPQYMYHRVLEVNFFDEDEKQSRTFLAYSLPKANDVYTIGYRRHLLSILKAQFGDKEFASYLETANYLGKEDKRASVFDLYLKDLGDSNKAEREALSQSNKDILSGFQAAENGRAVVQVQNVDTHQISTHKSADESHVTAFRMMVEAEKLGVEAEYKKPVKESDPSREVKITERGSLDSFVAKKNLELKQQIDVLVKLSDIELFNYLKENNLEVFDSKEFSGLSEKDLRKVKGIRFQAEAAKRFMDNMINDHRCDSGTYKYNTNRKASCGLTMEEMVATSYWASKNVSNFRKNSGVTELGNFILLVKQLYDMRRGYDIDHKIDKPEENEFPAERKADNNRCHGGGVNSLSWGLKSAHTAYNPVVILRTDIEREIGQIYKKIVKENLKLFKGQEEIIRIWNASGKITGVVRAALKREFEEKHQEEFVAYYKGYIADDAFYNVIENALDNIPVPEQFKKKSALERMSAEEIYQAIKNGKLPLLHSDSKRGIESTLQYLSSLAGKENIIEDLVNRAVAEDMQKPSVQKALHFLARSNIPQKYKDVEIVQIKGKPITLGDLANLWPNEVAGLFGIRRSQFLEESARQQFYNLFLLYVKKVGLTDEELNKGFGDMKNTPLSIAAGNCYVEVVRELIERGADVKIANMHYWTPLHWAVVTGNAEVVRELIERGTDVNIATRNTDFTPLHLAVGLGKEGDYTEVVKELIAKGADVNKAERQGDTPLSTALKVGNVEVVTTLLAHGASPSLNMLLYNTFSPEVNSNLRHCYIKSIKDYFFSPVIKLFKSIVDTILGVVSNGKDNSP